MTRKRPTIADVAQSAGVSVGTISNYLNGTASVREATRARIDQAVRLLAYRPSAFARRLSAGMPEGKHVDRATLPRLMVLGYVSVDYMCRLDVLPHRDDRITAHHIEKALGGPAANLAVAAAAIGANGSFGLDVELATALGDNADSDWAIAELEAKGVHALPIRRPHNNRLSRCIVFIEPNGSRTIVNEPFELSSIDLSGHVDIDRQGRSSCLHVEGYHYERLKPSLPAYRAAGWRLSLHSAGLSGASLTPAGFAQILRDFDLTLVGDVLLREIFGLSGSGANFVDQMVRCLDMPERGHVVVTQGSLGAQVLEKGAPLPLAVPAPPVRVVDATGAGDSFAGAFIAYWLNGATLQTAGRYAAAAGSRTTEVEGAQGVTSSHEDLCALLDPQEAAPQA